MKSSEILDRALSVIPDASRWTQGGRYRRMGQESEQYCAVGALSMAIWGSPHAMVADRPDTLSTTEIRLSPEQAAARNALCHAIFEQVGHNSIITFNDAMGRKYDEIRVIFEKARAALQERGE